MVIRVFSPSCRFNDACLQASTSRTNIGRRGRGRVHCSAAAGAAALRDLRQGEQALPLELRVQALRRDQLPEEEVRAGGAGAVLHLKKERVERGRTFKGGYPSPKMMYSHVNDVPFYIEVC